MKRKHRLYAKYKYRKHPAYQRAAKEADSEVIRSKKRFERKLAANIKSDVKSFYAYVSCKRKTKPSVGPVINKRKR